MVKFSFRQWETFDRLLEKKFKLKIERLVLLIFVDITVLKVRSMI